LRPPRVAGGRSGGRVFPPAGAPGQPPGRRPDCPAPRKPDDDAAGEVLPHGALQPVARRATVSTVRDGPATALPPRGDLPPIANLPRHPGGRGTFVRGWLDRPPSGTRRSQ